MVTICQTVQFLTSAVPLIQLPVKNEYQYFDVSVSELDAKETLPAFILFFFFFFFFFFFNIHFRGWFSMVVYTDSAREFTTRPESIRPLKMKARKSTILWRHSPEILKETLFSFSFFLSLSLSLSLIHTHVHTHVHTHSLFFSLTLLPFRIGDMFHTVDVKCGRIIDFANAIFGWALVRASVLDADATDIQMSDNFVF